MFKGSNVCADTLIGYKVVLQRNKQLWSFNTLCSMFRVGAVRYMLTEWSYPKKYCGSLMVFNTLGDVILFLSSVTPHIPIFMHNYNDPIKVYKCQYTLANLKSAFISSNTYGVISLITK